jgi:hypothetical protein
VAGHFFGPIFSSGFFIIKIAENVNKKVKLLKCVIFSKIYQCGKSSSKSEPPKPEQHRVSAPPNIVRLGAYTVVQLTQIQNLSRMRGNIFDIWSLKSFIGNGLTGPESRESGRDVPTYVAIV